MYLFYSKTPLETYFRIPYMDSNAAFEPSWFLQKGILWHSWLICISELLLVHWYDKVPSIYARLSYPWHILHNLQVIKQQVFSVWLSSSFPRDIQDGLDCFLSFSHVFYEHPLYIMFRILKCKHDLLLDIRYVNMIIQRGYTNFCFHWLTILFFITTIGFILQHVICVYTIAIRPLGIHLMHFYSWNRILCECFYYVRTLVTPYEYSIH